LVRHAEQPFHLLIGGGDQLYCDGCELSLLREFKVGTLFQSCAGTRNARMGQSSKKKREIVLAYNAGDGGRDRPVLLQSLLPVISQWSVRPR
jgi:hypothetical protein